MNKIDCIIHELNERAEVAAKYARFYLAIEGEGKRLDYENPAYNSYAGMRDAYVESVDTILAWYQSKDHYYG